MGEQCLERPTRASPDVRASFLDAGRALAVNMEEFVRRDPFNLERANDEAVAERVPILEEALIWLNTHYLSTLQVFDPS